MNIFEASAKITLDTREYREQVKAAKAELQGAETSMKNTGRVSADLKSKLSTLTKQYQESQKNVEQLTNAYNESIKKTESLTKETQDLTKRLDAAEKEVEDLKGALDQYTNSTSKAASKTDEDTKFMGKSWNAWNVTIIGAITGAVTAAAAAVTKLTKLGLSFNMEMEDYTTNFSTMLDSYDLAQEKVQTLKEMAAKTPFGIGDLSQATRTLLGFGIEAEKTENILKMLGDAALGDKTKLQSLSLAFAQATSAGKLMGQDLMQMINAGFNPLNSLAQQTGLSVGQLKEIMSGTSEEARATMLAMEGVTDYGKQIIEQGYISADDLYNALQSATSEDGLFFNGMEKSSQTLSGLISTLTDDFNALMGTAAKPLFEFLKGEVLPGAGNLVQAFADLLAGTGSAENVANIGSELFMKMMDGIATAAPALVDALVGGVNAIVAKLPIDKLAAAGGKLLGSLAKAFTKLLRGGAGILQQLAPELLASIPVFMSALLSAVDIGDVLRTFMFYNMDLLAQMLPELINTLTEIIPELISVITMELANQAPSIVTAVTSMLYNIFAGALQAVFNLVIELIPMLLNTVISALYGVGQVVLGVISGIYQNIAKIPDTVSNILSGNLTVGEAIADFKGIFAGGNNPVDALEFAQDWISSSTPTFSWSEGFTVSSERTRLSDYQPTSIGDVSVNVNVPNTNASPEDIGDAVAEAISVALEEFANRKGAAYGSTPVMAR